MEYIVLNGIKSTLIQGLMIQALPPISKPMIRTMIEEIDGRDGDIVTKLGYSAYDKEMSIGLFGDYDVDDVIQYFNSEGTVIFSNEPDKFYKYQIINQIDFEKLIRFKTATVVFHVQPFKYSSVDDAVAFSIDEMKLRPYTITQGGVTAKVERGLISLKGTPAEYTEIYIPINEMTLEGEYTLKALTEGTGMSGVKLRVIEDNPTDADSFGGTYLQLDSSATMTAETERKTFNYLWFYITNAVDFTLNLQMLDDDLDSCKVFNRGNTISRPTLTLYGSGTVKLSINGVELFQITIDEYITIDAEAMNAYKGDVLKNRSVIGDYADLVLNVGANIISWDGNITKIEIEKGSRWI